jgi:hypothetical protein
MIIQGSPEILRGPRGLNGFGDFGAAATQISNEANLEFMKSLEYMNWARSIPKLVLDFTTTYDSPIFGPQPGGTFGPAKDAAYQAFVTRGGAAPVLTDAVALDLAYRASTTGVPLSELDFYGGPAAVKAAARAAGYTGTPQNIQTYEVTNNIFESASTTLNKEFIGAEGEARLAQLNADLSSQNEAVVAQARGLYGRRAGGRRPQEVAEQVPVVPDELVPALDDVAAWLRWCETTGRWWGGTALAESVLGAKEELQSMMAQATKVDDQRSLDAYYEMVFGPDEDAAAAG